MLSPEDRLFFIHVPKTAGTTLIPLIDMHFHEREICPAQLWRELVRIPQETLPAYRLFRGHFGGGGLDSFLPKPPICMTMLRAPLPLAVSTFKFIQREPGTRVHKLVHDMNLDLAGFLDHSETRGKIANKQTRHLSFCLEHDPESGPIFMHDESLAVIDGWVKRHRARVAPRERLERAKAKLRDCAFFGLVERFEDSMDLMCHTFGWPPVGPVQKLRVAPHRDREQLDDTLLKRVAELNDQDIELYAFAERLFDERLKAMEANLARDAARTGRPEGPTPSRHEISDMHYLRGAAQRNAEPPARLRVNLDEPLFGDGWHRREPSSLDGSTFRWTGPGTRSTMDVAILPAADLRVTIRLINALAQDIYDSFALRANAEPVPLDLIEGRSSVRVLQGVIPRAVLERAQDGILRLEFLTSRTMSPRDRDSSNPDDRLVGVAVNWIDVSPAAEVRAGASPRIEIKPQQRAALRQRRREAIMTRLKQRVAAIPIVGPRLRTAYIRFKSK
jgi:hypothetical protein